MAMALASPRGKAYLELFHWCWGWETKIRMMMVFFLITCDLLALYSSKWAIPSGIGKVALRR